MRRVISYITEVLSRDSNASKLYLRAIPRNSTQFCIILYNFDKFNFLWINLFLKIWPAAALNTGSEYPPEPEPLQYLDWFLDQKNTMFMQCIWFLGSATFWLPGSKGQVLWKPKSELLKKRLLISPYFLSLKSFNIPKEKKFEIF